VADALRGEHVNVAKFVFRLTEVLHLDPALLDQGFEAVVHSTGTHAQGFGYLALRDVGIRLQQTHDAKGGVFLVFLTLICHVGCLGTLPPYRVTIGWRGRVCSKPNNLTLPKLSLSDSMRPTAFKKKIQPDCAANQPPPSSGKAALEWFWVPNPAWLWRAQGPQSAIPLLRGDKTWG